MGLQCSVGDDDEDSGGGKVSDATPRAIVSGPVRECELRLRRGGGGERGACMARCRACPRGVRVLSLPVGGGRSGLGVTPCSGARVVLAGWEKRKEKKQHKNKRDKSYRPRKCQSFNDF